MHDEAWQGPMGPGGHRRGHRARVRTGRRGVWAGPAGPFEFEMGGGPGGPFGPPGFRFRGPRVRRGDVRAAILDLLSEGQPWNGYQIIQEISARTEGVWRPSAGSVYPALQQLEDEGLVRAEAGEDRRRMYTLTDEGRAYVEAHADELRASWEAVTGSVDGAETQLRQTFRQVAVAMTQVAQAGSAAQVAQAATVLTDTRRALYRILAADDDETGEGTQA
ncbi:MAG: PadR family transcriptional regulator [Streptosporangiaceae bacterium]|nr:PadR family transcriptional regulator [Streptosporangiaceae bacterium]